MGDKSKNPFMKAFKGRFESIMRWDQLIELWDLLREDAESGWYIYTIGETPPLKTVSGELLKTFLSEIEHMLRNDHDEGYCGIIYTDSLEAPQFVKIFDPGHLGVSCGNDDKPPLPGWILSKLQPVELEEKSSPEDRRSWWQRLLST